MSFFKQPVDHVFSAADYNYALQKESNELYSWGRGDNYVLGTRDDENVFEPYLVPPKMFHEMPVLSVGAGSNHVVVLSGAEQGDIVSNLFEANVLEFKYKPKERPVKRKREDLAKEAEEDKKEEVKEEAKEEKEASPVDPQPVVE